MGELEGGRRPLFVAGAILGAVAVALGAFGAHLLTGRIPEAALATYETGARYAMYHALAALVAAAAAPGRGGMAAGWCFVAGSLVFSGALLLLALTGIGAFGAIAPIGGTLLIVGWLLLARAALIRR